MVMPFQFKTGNQAQPEAEEFLYQVTPQGEKYLQDYQGIETPSVSIISELASLGTGSIEQLSENTRIGKNLVKYHIDILRHRGYIAPVKSGM